MDVLKFAIILMFLFFPLLQIGRIQFPNAVAITLTDVLIVFCIIAWIVVAKPSLIKIRRNWLFVPLSAFFLVSLTSLFINAASLTREQFFVSLLYPLRWGAYASLVFITSQFDASFKRVIYFLMKWSGAAIVLLGFLQYAFYQDLRNLYYLGWDEHLYRMFSTFLDPNFAGAFFVLYLLFLMGEIVHRYSHKTTFLLIATFIAMILTHSRSALLMFLVSVSLFFVFLKKKRFIFLIVFALFFIILGFKPLFFIENINLFRIASSEARIDSMRSALTIIKDHPVMGVGFNAYRYALVRYNMRDGEKTFLSHADAGSDNSFLFVAATTGMIGLVFFCSIWIIVLKKTKDIVVITSIAGLLVNSFFINSIFYPSLLLWIWVLLGVRGYK